MIATWAFAIALQADPIVGRASVIDGDTLEIRGQRIRLWGIDAPEGRQTCMRAGETYRCGTDAANYLDTLIADRPVNCRSKGRPDRYGRVVATCQVMETGCERGADVCVVSTDLNASMVLGGHALDYAQFSRGAYAEQQADARARRRGVWAGDFQLPWDWRRSRR
jgi:endonuclease YncB( thermonuclease family)